MDSVKYLNVGQLMLFFFSLKKNCYPSTQISYLLTQKKKKKNLDV